MNEALPSAAEVAAHVAADYGVPVRSATPLSGGYVHPAWRLALPDGAWFAKWYRGPVWRDAQLAPVLEAQAVGVAAGLPVPSPLPAWDGRFFTPLRDGLLVCSDFLPGAAPAALTTAMAHAAGAALGRLHVALAALPAGTPRVPDAAAIAVQCKELLAAAEAAGVGAGGPVGGRDAAGTGGAVVAPPPAMPAVPEGDRLAAESLRYRLQALQDPGIDAAAYAACTWQFCHGDYYPGNLLFQGEALTGIVDFDFAAPRWRTLEVARAAVETARWAGDFDPGLFRAVLAGYQSTNPLAPAELQAGPRLWWEYLLQSLYPIPTRYRDAASLPVRWAELVQRRHSLMTWLGERLPELAALCTPA